MWCELIQKLDSDSSFFPAVTTEQIAHTEKVLQVALPAELKELMLETNGITDVYELGIIWSIDQIKDTNLLMRTDHQFKEIYMPFDSLLFFAEAGNGDCFGFSIIEGTIKFQNIFAWNHENDSRTWVAPSLRTYLNWLFEGKINI